MQSMKIQLHKLVRLDGILQHQEMCESYGWLWGGGGVYHEVNNKMIT